jgi:hypothetical protein
METNAEKATEKLVAALDERSWKLRIRAQAAEKYTGVEVG